MNGEPTLLTPEQQIAADKESVRLQRVTGEQARLRYVILRLASQLRNRSMMDRFLACLSPETAVDGRLPLTPKLIMAVEDRVQVLHNMVGLAILKWGRLARQEADVVNADLPALEVIAATGFRNYGAYPIERNSAIMVLRTALEETKIREERQKAADKAFDTKTRIIEKQNEKTETRNPEPPQNVGGSSTGAGTSGTGVSMGSVALVMDRSSAPSPVSRPLPPSRRGGVLGTTPNEGLSREMGENEDASPGT